MSREVARAFGQVLREARRSARMSQDRLALLAAFDRTCPSLLERGLRQPSMTMILRLAAALGVEPERLVTDTVARLREL